MSPARGVDRRRFLRGILCGSAVTVGLPALEVFLGPKAMASGGFPQRFGTWIWGNGNLPDRWTPSAEGVGAEWALSEQLAAFAPYKSKLTVVSGFSVKVPNTIPHWSGIAGLLCGVNAPGDDSDWTVGGPTVDQVLANDANVGGQTIYRSLQVGVEHAEVFSFSGPNAQLFGETDPHALYERLFGGNFRVPGDEGIADPRLGYRRSVLDAVMGDIEALEKRVGKSDRERLEQHFDGVRDLERRLARLQEDPPNLASCAYPTEPAEAYPEIDGRPQVSAKARAMADLVAMALACDQTRVFTLQLHRAVSNVLFPGASDGHHNLTHNEPAPQDEVDQVVLQCLAEAAYFVGALDAIPEGEETLLDHCAVLVTSDVSEGRTHSLDEFPILLAGSCCGKLRTDLHLRSHVQENASRVMLQLVQTMGINQTHYGDQAQGSYTDDPLTELAT